MARGSGTGAGKTEPACNCTSFVFVSIFVFVLHFNSNLNHFSSLSKNDHNLRSNRVFVFGLSDIVANMSYTSPSERRYMKIHGYMELADPWIEKR